MRSRTAITAALASAGAAAMILAVSAGSASTPAEGPIPHPAGSGRTIERHDRQQDRQRILRTLESREQDARVLQQMREKVAGLTDAQMRLAVCLCARIDGGDRSVAADLAFSLMTALILLS